MGWKRSVLNAHVGRACYISTVEAVGALLVPLWVLPSQCMQARPLSLISLLSLLLFFSLISGLSLAAGAAFPACMGGQKYRGINICQEHPTTSYWQ